MAKLEVVAETEIDSVWRQLRASAEAASRGVARAAPPADLWERIRRGFAMPDLDSDLVRDREGGWDGIHLCFECKHLGKSRKCLKAGQTALPFTLMRCDGFEAKA